MSTIVRIPDDAVPGDILVIDTEQERTYCVEDFRLAPLGSGRFVSYKTHPRVTRAEVERAKGVRS